MNNILKFTANLILLIFVISCSKEDSGNPVDVQFEFDAVGTIEEQTVEEAKKTINGKWDVQTSASSSKNAITCSFYGVEFTDDRFALRFDVQGVDSETGENIDESIYAYGPYTLNENSEGLVTSVDLFETVDGIDYKIASLTDIVVEESANDLNANFNVEFDLPDDIAEDFPCGNLSGDYDAEKDEPIVSEEAGSGNTNFAKLVNTWSLDRVVEDGDEGSPELYAAFENEDEICQEVYSSAFADIEGQVQVLFDQLFNQGFEEFIASNPEATESERNAYFEQADQELTQFIEANQPSEEEFEALQEQCEEAVLAFANTINADIEVAFSAYGSYIFSLSINGETIEVDVEEWRFNGDESQIIVDGGETTLTIDKLTDTELTVTESGTDVDEETGESESYSATYYFSIVN